MESCDEAQGLPEDATAAERLILDGWHQVSAQYRTVARLPVGKTGRQALYDAEVGRRLGGLDGEQAERLRRRTLEWVNRMGEAAAADYFLRVHARAAGLWMELEPAEWHRFKKAGGRPAR